MKCLVMIRLLLPMALAAGCSGEDEDKDKAPATQEFGDLCKVDGDCVEGLHCQPSGNLQEMCVADCEEDDDCHAMFGEASLCAAFAKTCTPTCTAHEDCASGKCAFSGGFCFND